MEKYLDMISCSPDAAGGGGAGGGGMVESAGG